MGNKSFLTTFIAVLTATLFFYGISVGAAMTFDNLISKKNNFGKQSYIGTFNVSNLKEDEAKGLLSASFQELEQNFRIDLIYQDATAKLPVEAITYDLDRTTKLAESGRENVIRSTVNENVLKTVLRQQFSTLEFTDEDLTDIALGVEKELETGIMPVKVYVNDLMKGTAFEQHELARASMDISSLSASIDDLIQILDGMEIAPISTFSLLKFIEEQDIGFVDNQTLTAVASILYATVLQTNFNVDERYIGEELHPDVPIGYEASVNQLLGIDFIFTNPNKSLFTLNMARVGQEVSFSINGLPFIYTYDTNIGSISSFKPRTIEQFSAMLSHGSKRVKQEGSNGQEVIVYGTVFDGGVQISHAVISTDFYTPIPRIEVLPLVSDEVPTTDSDGVSDSEDNAQTTDQDGVIDSEADDVDGTTTGSGKPGSKPGIGGETEVEYDKGGNVIQ